VTSAGELGGSYRYSEDGKEIRAGLSSMIETVTVLLGLFSVSIFLAHALDAYNAR